MKYRTTAIVGMALIFLNIFAGLSKADNVNIYCDGATRPTEFKDEHGNLTGLSVDVVRELQKRVGNTGKIRSWPWIRAYQTALTKPDTVLFTTSRNADRETRFHWIFHVTTRRTVLFGKRGTSLKINSIEDAKKVRGIGILRGGNREKYLKERGFSNLKDVARHEQNLQKLLKGRIDLIFMSSLEAALLAKKVGVSFSEIEPIYSVHSNDSYIILSKNGTALGTVKKWTEAAREMKADGTFRKIGDKWTAYIRNNYGLETEVRNDVFYFWKE